MHETLQELLHAALRQRREVFRNRIVELRRVRAFELRRNPRPPGSIQRAQRSPLAELLRTIGLFVRATGKNGQSAFPRCALTGTLRTRRHADTTQMTQAWHYVSPLVGWIRQHYFGALSLRCDFAIRPKAVVCR